MAVQGISIDGIKDATRAYLQGKVKRPNQAFAPSAAEFAEQCRYQEYLAKVAAMPVRELEAPEENFTEEHRVEMLEKLSLLGRHLAGDPQAMQALKSMGYDVAIQEAWSPPA